MSVNFHRKSIHFLQMKAKILFLLNRPINLFLISNLSRTFETDKAQVGDLFK